MSRLVIIGPAASGKSRLGRRLAEALDIPFVDTDKRVVAAHGPIPDIFREHGEATFRRWERDAVVAALGEDAVVSFGGGAVLDPRTRQDLADQTVLLLTMTPEAAARRLGRDAAAKRPLLAEEGAWQRLADERMPIYLALADGVIDTSHGNMRRVLEETLEWLRVVEATK